VASFTDEEVLSEVFQDTIRGVVAVMTPFVHLLVARYSTIDH
jgi:hypothetical protein